MPDDADQAGVLRADDIEALAQAIHAGYQRHQRADGDRRAHPADVPWERLPEDYRESSSHQAADVIRKLAAVGCVAEPVRRDGSPRLPSTRAKLSCWPRWNTGAGRRSA